MAIMLVISGGPNMAGFGEKQETALAGETCWL